MKKKETQLEQFAIIKQRIQETQNRAAIAVNTNLLYLYWEIGTYVSRAQKELGWGSNVVKELSDEIRTAFPKMTGFSVRNIKYMIRFATTYDISSISKYDVLSISDNSNSEIEASQYTDIEHDAKVQPAAALLPDNINEKVQPLAALVDYASFTRLKISLISWTHHMVLLDKTDSMHEKYYYIDRVTKESWSRRVLAHKIEQRLYESQGTLPNNFDLTLPTDQSVMVKTILKDPYIFDFLSLGHEAKERDIENALLKQITKFLLELGQGFAFLGQQYHMQVGSKDYYLDLLFYHTKLRAYFILELKIDDFKPEYAGKLNFYINAVDDIIKTEADNPTIGLLLCKSADKVIAEYSLRDLTKPIGVATYELLPDKKDLIALVERGLKIQNQLK